jgi:hypothetical protein
MDNREQITTENAFAQQFESQMLRQRTIMLGQIVAFDSAKNSVNVQPVLQRKFVDDKEPSNLPIINDVPVAYFGGGGFWITVEPAVGDYCILLISDRAIERWKQTGGIVSPVKARHHDMNDAVAYLGLNPFNNALSNIASNAIHIRSRDGQAGIKLTDSAIELTQDGQTIGTVTGSSVSFTVNVTAPDFVTDSGVSLGSHTHPGDSGGTTGAPN